MNSSALESRDHGLEITTLHINFRHVFKMSAFGTYGLETILQ